MLYKLHLTSFQLRLYIYPFWLQDSATASCEQRYSTTVLQCYSATVLQQAANLAQICSKSRLEKKTRENHALQIQFDQFSAPAVHLPFLASMPDVLEASLALRRCSATARWVVEQPTPQPKCIQH